MIDKYLVESSSSHKMALQMGLKFAGFGRYKNAQGKVTHKTVDGKLVKIEDVKNDNPKYPKEKREIPSEDNKKHIISKLDDIEKYLRYEERLLPYDVTLKNNTLYLKFQAGTSVKTYIRNALKKFEIYKFFNPSSLIMVSYGDTHEYEIDLNTKED